MQSSDWPAEHCGALREYRALGMSFLQIAKAINAKFGTAYSRSAVIGRARRMGLTGPGRRKDGLRHWLKRPAKAKARRLPGPPQCHVPEPRRPTPVLARREVAKLRCVDIEPRHLGLVDLEASDCRYPYGGDEDGEIITFCGHPRRPGSSYCAPHFHLTRGPGTRSERATGAVSLRLVEAA
jgi:GcrA cell cycle regulator